MRQILQVIRSRIQYTVILPYLLLMILVMLAGSGIAIQLVAGSWQERFNNQLGQVARNFAETFAQRELKNIDYLGLIIFTAPNATTGAPAVPPALEGRDTAGLELAMQSLWTLGLGADKVDQDRVIIFDAAGKALLDWERSGDPAQPTRYVATDLSQQPLVQAVLRGDQTAVANTDVVSDKYSGLLSFRTTAGEDVLHFFTVVPVRQEGAVVGGVMVAQRLDRLLQYLQQQSQSAVSTVYDVGGTALASTAPESETATLNMSPELIAQVAALNTPSGAATAAAGNRPRSGSQSDPCLDIGTLTGRLITPLESTRLPNCSVSTTASLAEREYQVVYAPLLIRGVQSGYFSIGLSRDFVITAWSSSRNAVIGVTALLAVMSVVVGYRVARGITRPLNDLVQTAEAVSAGDLQRRSAVRDANELGTLASAFNQMTEHLLRLYTVSRELNRTIEIDEVLAVASEAAAAFTPGAEAVALLAVGEVYAYRVRPGVGQPLAGLAGRTVEAGNPLIAAVAAHDPQAPQMLPLSERSLLDVGGLGAAGVRSALAAPIFQQPQLIGALLFVHPAGEAFDETARQSLAVVANMAGAVLSNAALYSRVQEDAKQRRAILTSIGDGVVVCDERGRITLLNRAAEQMLDLAGWGQGQLRLDDLPLEQVAQSQGQVRLGERYLTLTRAPVVAEDGQAGGEVIVLHDITDAVLVDQAKNDFIATISHELRSPLTVIRGYTELLLRGTGGQKPTADQTELLETVRNRAVEMTDMVNNAILIADIDSGKLKTELAPQDIELVLSMALGPMRGAFEAKGLSVTVELPAELPAVLADREHLKRVFSQLLDNARRYTSSGGVTVRAAALEGVVQVDVIDTGPGISAEMLPRLFKRFQRVDGNNSQQRGGGLGLNITRQLVELQGGRVSAVSVPGQGSTFSVTLVQAHEQSFAVAQSNNSTATP